MSNAELPLTHQLAKQFRDAYFGGNWTAVNVHDVLADVDWKQATTQVQRFNTIAALVYHTGYYVSAIIEVLTGRVLAAHDSDSFKAPPIGSQEDWTALLDKTWSDAKTLADLIERLPETMLSADFFKNKYGTCFRNICGVIEHTHYHLGQIVLIKKLIANDGNAV